MTYSTILIIAIIGFLIGYKETRSVKKAGLYALGGFVLGLIVAYIFAWAIILGIGYLIYSFYKKK